MKKLDILLIFLVTVASIAIFYSYFEKLSRPNNDSQLQVYFHSIALGDRVSLESSTNLEYHVLSSADKKSLDVFVLNKETNSTKKYTYNVEHKDLIDHVIIVTYNDIRIVEASCPGQDCLRMQMNHNRKVPIVCILGISIMFEEFDIII